MVSGGVTGLFREETEGMGKEEGGVLQDRKQVMGRVGRCQLRAHLHESLERKQASKEDHPHDVTGKDTFLCQKL